MKSANKCCLCGEGGKRDFVRQDVRRGAEYHFCAYHFNRYMFTKTKKIRELIKRAKRPQSI